MSKIFYVIALCSILLSKSNENPRGFIVKVGDTAPDFSMMYTTGEKYNLSDFKGSTVVLQFTASWCSVCRIEMPHLEKDVWQTYKNKNVILIGIDRDEPLSTVIKFKNDMKTTYPLALDPNAEIFSLFAEKNSGVTRNVVIDKDGKISFLTRLFEESEYQEMLKVIKNLTN